MQISGVDGVAKEAQPMMQYRVVVDFTILRGVEGRPSLEEILMYAKNTLQIQVKSRAEVILFYDALISWVSNWKGEDCGVTST